MQSSQDEPIDEQCNQAIRVISESFFMNTSCRNAVTDQYVPKLSFKYTLSDVIGHMDTVVRKSNKINSDPTLITNQRIYDAIPGKFCNNLDQNYTNYWFNLHYITEMIAYELQTTPSRWISILFLGFRHGCFVNFRELYDKYPDVINHVYNDLIKHRKNKTTENPFNEEVIYEKVYLYISKRKQAFTRHYFERSKEIKKRRLSETEQDFFKKAYVCYALPFYIYMNIAMGNKEQVEYLYFYPKVEGVSRSSYEIQNDGSLSNIIFGFQKSFSFASNLLSCTSYSINHISKTKEGVFDIARQLPTFRSKPYQVSYPNTLLSLHKLKILTLQEHNVLAYGDENKVKRWMKINYTMKYFTQRWDKINKSHLNAWYSFVALGYHHNKRIILNNHSLRKILTLYNQIAKKRVPLIIPNVDALYSIFTYTRNSTEDIHEYNTFFDIMFLRPFLKWINDENIEFPVKHVKDVVIKASDVTPYVRSIVSIGNNDENMLFEQEVIVHRYRLVRLLFPGKGHALLPSAARAVQKSIDAMIDIVNTYRNQRDMYMNIMNNTQFFTFDLSVSFFEVYQSNYWNGMSMARFTSGSASGDGIKRQWFSNEYTSENVLTYLLWTRSEYDPFSQYIIQTFKSILCFGYLHCEGLQVKKPLFDFLIDTYNLIYNKDTKNPLRFPFELVESSLWYLIGIENGTNSELSTDLFLQTQYKCSANKFRKVYEVPSNIYQGTSHMIEDTLDIKFSQFQDFIKEVFVVYCDKIVIYDMFTLRNAVRIHRDSLSPYFTVLKNTEYMEVLFECFIDSKITFEKVVSLLHVYTDDHINIRKKHQIDLYKSKMIDILQQFDNDEAKLKQFVFIVTGQNRLPPKINICVTMPSDVEIYSATFAIHVCTNTLDFPANLLEVDSQTLADEILLFSDTFNGQGGSKTTRRYKQVPTSINNNKTNNKNTTHTVNMTKNTLINNTMINERM